jgi:phosphoribosylaminoimidazolecarboxamide formyltransferase/IMP cyclohydrolase
MQKQIKNALISVYYKDGLEPLIRLLASQGTALYSSGGTYQYIKELGLECIKVEDLTGFPEILDGRVKTLHPKVFGGLLGIQENDLHKQQLYQHQIPAFDLMICTLYPFKEYLQKEATHQELIEKIDIGGVSLIRAAAKNYNDVLCVADASSYSEVLETLQHQKNDLGFRKKMAAKAFKVISEYDLQIANYFNTDQQIPLRYGENPHQKAAFQGDLKAIFEQLHGKEISYNNILDLDAAVKVIAEFEAPTFAILKHNNTCGLASDSSLSKAYQKALASDPVSAFGGVLICNRPMDIETATLIDTLFCEILVAPAYEEGTFEILSKKKNRIILIQKTKVTSQSENVRTVLNGQLIQDADQKTENRKDWNQVSGTPLTEEETLDLEFSIKAVKHLKSNAIALVKNQQLVAMGCGMVSRVDALRHAIKKAEEFGLSLEGATMASDAFFPFADCVDIANQNGIKNVAQPGGSIKDQDSIDFCINNNMKMVLTGVRHFNH